MPLGNSSASVTTQSNQNSNAGTNQQSGSPGVSSNNNASSSSTSGSSGPLYMPNIPTLGCHRIRLPAPVAPPAAPAAAPPAAPAPAPGKAVLTKLGTDETIEDSAAAIRNKRNPQALDMSPAAAMTSNSVPTQYEAAVSHQEVDYSQVGQFAPIVITGHMGSKIPVFGVNVWVVSNVLAYFFDRLPSWAPQWIRNATNLHATNFEGKNPKEIVEHLIKRGLSKDYAGVIYLDGCSGAYGQEASFAAEVYRRLVEKGYVYLQIKSNLGEASTDTSGQETVTWPEAQWSIVQATKRRDAAKKAYEKARGSNEGRRYNDLSAAVTNASSALVRLEKQRANATPDQVANLDMQIANAKSTLQNTRTEFEEFCAGAGREIAELAKELDYWEAVLNKLEDTYEIKNLTGTWGPERLPPKT